MPNVNLDAAFVRSAICPEGKGKVDYYDNSITGFVLEARSTGGMTYYLRYRDPHGRQRQQKIGDAKSISFDDLLPRNYVPAWSSAKVRLRRRNSSARSRP